MDDIHKNIEEYIPNKKPKILIIIANMTADTFSNKKLNPTVAELFMIDKMLNISLVFVAQSYFSVPKNIMQNSTHNFVMKILNKRKLKQGALFNHSSNIGFKDLMNLYKKSTAKPYYFSIIDATLASVNLLRLRKNLLERI